MGIVKRLYIYAVSAITLLVLAIGLYSLVAVALGEIVDRVGATVIGGGSTGREQLSLAIALVVVGAPVFVIHWWLVGRGWRSTDGAASEDRHSAIRAFHMGLVASVALTVAMYAALRLLDRGVRAVLGVPSDGLVADEVSLLLVATPVWWFHLRTRNDDLRHDRLHGAAAWLSRLYRHGWAFIGLMFLLVGASQLIDTVASTLIGRSDFGSGQDWWRGPLAWSLAAIITGLVIGWLHINDARRAMEDAELIGEEEGSTALRMTYFGAVLLVALVSTGLAVAASITQLGRQLLGVADRSGGAAAILETVVGPIVVVVPFALAGWLHWTALRVEAANRGDARMAVAVRLGLHLAALVGIAFLTVGVARLGGLLLEQAVGSVGADDFFRGELVWCVAQIVVGAASWLPAWSTILRRRTAAPAPERLATTARAYLVLVVAAALIAGVPSAVFVLFRLIDTLLGGGTIALGADLSIPLAVVAVATVVAIYHVRLVVSDMRLASAQAVEGTAETHGTTAQAVEATPKTQATSTVASPTAAGQPTVPSLPTTLALVLRGPGDEDLEAVLVSLRDHLPPGVVLEGG